MKAIQILNELNLKSDKDNKAHANKLIEIYKSLEDLAEKVISVDITKADIFFARSGNYNHWSGEYNFNYQGEKKQGEKWVIKTANACYTVTVPVNTIIHNSLRKLFTGLLNLDIQVSEPGSGIVCDGALLDLIKTASRFIIYDKFSTARNCVHLNIKDGACEVMGTDGFVVFTKSAALNTPDAEILLPVNELKTALRINAKELILIINPDKEKIKSGSINGVLFSFYCEGSLSHFKTLIPDYKKSIEVNRKEFIKSLTLASFSANKITHAVNIHINGSIQVSAEDLDFSNESCVTQKYITKNTPDFDILLNSKKLINSLNSLKSKTVNLLSDGAKDKCVLISEPDSEPSILLMPIVTTW